MSTPVQPSNDAKRLMEVTLKVNTALMSSKHPDVAAAGWAMMNLVHALAINGLSKRSFNTRIEGNVFAAMCFRNGPIEDVHSGLEKLDDDQMKNINVWTSRAMTGMLTLKEICFSLGSDGQEFWRYGTSAYHDQFCSNWETSHIPPALPEEA